MSGSGGARTAVVLLSGGLDSTTTLYEALAAGFRPRAVSFDYGQRHRHELDAARAICQHGGLDQPLVFRLGLDDIGGSALTDRRMDVPKDRELEGAEIPSTYVPARNTIFLSVALAVAERFGASDIFLGANAIDYSGYPDCRPEYLRAFEAMAQLATRAGVEGTAHYRIHAPLLHLDKAAIVRRGVELGVPFELTHSCYDPVPATDRWLACGRCDSCRLRRRGFQRAGLEDPVSYAVS